MTLWLAMGVMCLAAALAVAWPLYRNGRRVSPLVASVIAVVVILSLSIYTVTGSPGQLSAGKAEKVPDIEEMVASLAERLEEEPEDLDGWKMLGRSYLTLQNFAGAVQAYEKAVALENSENAQTLVDLGVALLSRDGSQFDRRSIALFESALALEPNNPSALFYGGLAAVQRDEVELAAERWEILLALNPPEEIRAIIEARIAQWRGETHPTVDQPPAEEGTSITIAVSVGETARQSLPADATVFVIARDPAQPSPPIAVSRRTLSELPATVILDDGDSMIPGRNLSAFGEVELIARISVSSQPVAQSGDWFASVVADTAETKPFNLHIDQRVP